MQSGVPRIPSVFFLLPVEGLEKLKAGYNLEVVAGASTLSAL